jgi:hypothetical protein
MGADLRRGRSPKAFERFKVYPTNTNKKEILEHTAICKGVFRGVGYGQEIHTKDQMGNALKTLVKRDGVETDDKINVMVGDLVYNTYSKELFIVEDWENIEDDDELEFSTRPSSKKRIKLRKSGLDG